MKLLLFLLVAIVLASATYAVPGGISIAYGEFSVNITNEPPKIVALSVTPNPSYEGDVIICNATAFDFENNSIKTHYAWFINSTLSSNQGRSMQAEFPGSVLSCEATPEDDYQNGTSAVASSLVLPLPIASRAMKTVLKMAGVNKNSSEIVSTANKGLIAATGYVVGGIVQEPANYTFLLFFGVVFLILININLILRLKKRRHSAP